MQSVFYYGYTFSGYCIHPQMYNIYPNALMSEIYMAVKCACFLKCSQYGDKKKVSEIFKPLFIFNYIN